MAQQAGKMTLVGVLLINAAADPQPARPLLRNSLRRDPPLLSRTHNKPTCSLWKTNRK